MIQNTHTTRSGCRMRGHRDISDTARIIMAIAHLLFSEICIFAVVTCNWKYRNYLLIQIALYAVVQDNCLYSYIFL